MCARGRERDNDNKSKAKPNQKYDGRTTSKQDQQAMTTLSSRLGAWAFPPLGLGSLVPLYCKHASPGEGPTRHNNNKNKTRAEE